MKGSYFGFGVPNNRLHACKVKKKKHFRCLIICIYFYLRYQGNRYFYRSKTMMVFTAEHKIQGRGWIQILPCLHPLIPKPNISTP